MYNIHLERAKYLNVTWQYIKTATNAQLDKIMDSIYQKLNKKLDALQKHKSHNENNKETRKHTSHTRLIQLTHLKFSNDQIHTLNLGFDYAEL